MDPTQPPTQQPPQTPPKIIVPQPKPNYLKTIIFSVLIIFTVGLIAYLIFQNQKLQKQVLNPQVSPTIQVPTPKTVSSISIPPDETAGWKTFTGNSLGYSNSVYSGYSLKYPPICSLTDKILTCKTKHGIATLIIDAGGHGGGITEIKVLRDNETKVIPAGEGKINEIKDMTNNKVTGTFWINKTDKLKQEPIFGFEFKDIPSEDVDEFEVIFDQILSTFKFIDQQNLCVLNDKTICDFFVDKTLKTNDIDYILSLQKIISVTCLKSQPFNPKMCEGVPDGEKRDGYSVGLIRSEGTFYTQNEYKIFLNDYLKNIYNYHGIINNNSKAVIVFTSLDKKTLLVFPFVKKNEIWTINFILFGFDQTYLDLDKQVLDWFN